MLGIFYGDRTFSVQFNEGALWQVFLEERVVLVTVDPSAKRIRGFGDVVISYAQGVR